MSEFKEYVRSNLAEMRAYVIGEDLSKISISKPDINFIEEINKLEEFDSPVGFIARNPENHEDQWYVNPDYAVKNFEPIQCNAMTFGMAIEVMKQGGKVQRSGWNGKGMFVYFVSGRKVPREALCNEANFHYPLEVVGDIKICDHVDMKASDGSIVIGWLASQTDMLAEDWEIVA